MSVSRIVAQLLRAAKKRGPLITTLRLPNHRLLQSMYRRPNTVLLIVIFAAVIFYALTVRGGMTWSSDDQGIYLMHAQNIASGKPYEQTNYVYNPEASLVGPRFFPPVWPAFLAIPYRLHGYDVETLKLYMVAIFGGILALTFVLARNRLNARA